MYNVYVRVIEEDSDRRRKIELEFKTVDQLFDYLKINNRPLDLCSSKQEQKVEQIKQEQVKQEQVKQEQVKQEQEQVKQEPKVEQKPEQLKQEQKPEQKQEQKQEQIKQEQKVKPKAKRKTKAKVEKNNIDRDKLLAECRDIISFVAKADYSGEREYGDKLREAMIREIGKLKMSLADLSDEELEKVLEAYKTVEDVVTKDLIARGEDPKQYKGDSK